MAQREPGMAEAPSTGGVMDLDTREARRLGLTLWKRESCWGFKQEGTSIKLPLFPEGEG